MKTCFQPAAELSDVGPVALVSEQAQLFADKGTEPLWEEDLESQSHAAARKRPKKTERNGRPSCRSVHGQALTQAVLIDQTLSQVLQMYCLQKKEL